MAARQHACCTWHLPGAHRCLRTGTLLRTGTATTILCTTWHTVKPAHHTCAQQHPTSPLQVQYLGTDPGMRKRGLAQLLLAAFHRAACKQGIQVRTLAAQHALAATAAGTTAFGTSSSATPACAPLTPLHHLDCQSNQSLQDKIIRPQNSEKHTRCDTCLSTCLRTIRDQSPLPPLPLQVSTVFAQDSVKAFWAHMGYSRSSRQGSRHCEALGGHMAHASEHQMGTTANCIWGRHIALVRMHGACAASQLGCLAGHSWLLLHVHLCRALGNLHHHYPMDARDTPP